ncbi:MAG: zinc-binding dehydrogenase, partial [Acidimicrobiia bacterium]|nr:zinc-binding dehydrogenase [Acidimicrobiia bacterium]
LGGVGLSAVQGAVHTGADSIVAIDIVPQKLAFARELGATHVVNATEPHRTKVVREATSGVGPDFVFVTVGVRSAIDQALGMVRRGGTVVFVGMPPTGLSTEIEVTNLADGSQTLMGSKMGSGRMAHDVPRLIELYRSGDLVLDGLISHTYPLEEINEAIAEVKAGEVVRNLIQFV